MQAQGTALLFQEINKCSYLKDMTLGLNKRKPWAYAKGNLSFRNSSQIKRRHEDKCFWDKAGVFLE